MPTADALLSLALTDVKSPLPKSDLIATLSAPPFVPLDGTFNTRDLGLLPTAGDVRIQPGLVYRTGSLSGLTEEGRAALRDQLGVKKVFDLRSVAENANTPDPHVEGVEMVWAPSEEGDAFVELEQFVEGVGEKGFVTMYMDVLRMYADSFRGILKHVRDREGEAFLFHCNAGRDRTGVAAGMLLALAGVDKQTATLDFMLSRIGTEPAREQLLAFAMRGAGVESVDAPGFYNLCSLKVECWEAFIEALQREYGGWEGYVTGMLGFSEEDLVAIKRNLTGE